jgi:hypothetical protein
MVTPTTAGWKYWIDTFTRKDYFCEGNYDQREDCQDAATHHLAQHLWEHTEDDNLFVVGLSSNIAKDIKRWCAWQRSYITLRAEGKTDHEAHQLARSEATP